jgi:putative phosphoesterase
MFSERSLIMVDRVGVISDTHGLLRPQALDALRDVSLIVHAGDVEEPQILDTLRAAAPLVVVRGNVDHGAWAEALPETASLSIAGVSLFVLHDLSTLAIDPATVGIDVVIFGHSHKPGAERRNGVLYVNPGSAGPRRFRLPVSVAILTIDAGRVDAEIIPLVVGG